MIRKKKNKNVSGTLDFPIGYSCGSSSPQQGSIAMGTGTRSIADRDNTAKQIIDMLKQESFVGEPTFDIEGHSNHDSERVVKLDRAIEIIQEVLYG